MDSTRYVRLLNTEVHTGKFTVVLLDVPILLDSHWDACAAPHGRSRLCAFQVYRLRSMEAAKSICRWCELEKQPIGRHYAPVMAPPATGSESKDWQPALIQMPLAFVIDARERIKRGRVVHVFDLGHKSKKPRWQTDDMRDGDKMPAPFDVVEVMLRITGTDLPPLPGSVTEEGSATIPFKRKA